MRVLLFPYQERIAMEEHDNLVEINDEDLRAALNEMKVYLDVTEEDLKKIYMIAHRHAKERLVNLKPVLEFMATEVVSVRTDTEVKDASRLILERELCGLPVVDDENRVVGVVSETDILCAIGEGHGHGVGDVLKYLLLRHPHIHKSGHRVGDIMSTPAVTISAGMDVKAAANIMEDKGIKMLPVVDDDGKLVGIVSRADIIRVVSGL